MREDICTIPVNDAFLEKDGCPICRMRSMLEERALEYITGAAMMEPDVRIVTNKQGFCGEHMGKLAARRSSLPLALMLQTHLEDLGESLFLKNDKDGKIAAARLSTCFICEKVEWGMEHMLQTVYVSFERDREFRALMEEQPTICLPHYQLLLSGIKKSGLKRYSDEFRACIRTLAERQLNELNADLKHFCSMFDYRNNGSDDWGNSKTAIERTVRFRAGDISGKK